ncbi:MAG: response regulator [Candidatus Heimdallarchaeota archaeon]
MEQISPSGAPDRAIINVLHVDDDIAFLQLTKDYLESNYRELQVESLSTPRDAFEKLRQGKADVIVADFQMPYLDGLELLSQLRERNIDIPYIIFTGKGREEVVIRALNLGADYYLQKGDPKVAFAELNHFIRIAVSKKEAEESLQRSEQQLQTIYNTILDAVLLIDSDFNVTLCNAAVQRMLGYTPEEIIGKSYLSIIPEEMLVDAKQQERQEELFKKGHLEQENYLFRKKNGEIFQASFSVVLIRNEQNKLVGMLGTIRDTSKLQEMEDDLSAALEKCQKLEQIINQKGFKS